MFLTFSAQGCDIAALAQSDQIFYFGNFSRNGLDITVLTLYLHWDNVVKCYLIKEMTYMSKKFLSQ